jgi:Zn-dependent protease with chaperone function
LRRGFVVALVLPLLACAGPIADFPTIDAVEIREERRRQVAEHLRTYVAQYARLYGIYDRIAAANAEFCAHVGPRHGFVAVTSHELPEGYRLAGRSVLQLDREQPTVIVVAEGSPAAAAGMAVGDVLLAFNGEPIPAREEAHEWMAAKFEEFSLSRLRVTALRGGKPLSLDVAPVAGCAYQILLQTHTDPGAFTDGRRIVFQSALLRVAQTDAELAHVVGHELAHITLGHIEKAQGNYIAGTIGGFLVDVALATIGLDTRGGFMRDFGDAGARAFSVDFEREADYVGAYFIARAGYDPRAAEALWRAMGQENPRNIRYAGTHPTSPERFILMQRAIGEIAYKRNRGLPLHPEMRAQAVAQQAQQASND